jgi:hypothetical protein
MTDQELERRLRSWFRAEIDEHDVAPAGLQLSVAAIPAHERRVVRWPWRFPTMRPSLRLAAVALITVLAVGGAFYLFGRGQLGIGGPSASPSEPASRSASPSASVVPVRPASWTATGSGGISGGTATTLLDGRVLVTGGGPDSASAELYDPRTGTWTATGSMLSKRGSFSATLLGDGRVLVAGGTPLVSVGGNKNTRLAAAELFDPDTGTWSATGSMIEARSEQTATRLPDGRVLVAGGIGAYGNVRVVAPKVLATAELYDPDTGSWTATGGLSTPRVGQQATLLGDGRVLVVGGMTYSGDGEEIILASAEAYDPGDGTWTKAGTMGTARTRHTATLLADGRVLVAGGVNFFGMFSGDVVASAELYDPASGTWTATGSMGSPSAGLTAIPLLNGKVLVLGVRVATAQLSADLYDPGSGSWSPTVSTDIGPTSGFLWATRLGDGRVLAAASDNGTTFVQLFDPGNEQ